jgi:hypothetical protein
LGSITGLIPTTGKWSVNSSNPASVNQMYFNETANIGSVQVTQGFDLYYEILNGGVCTAIFMNINDPTEWATYQRMSFSVYNSSTWVAKNPIYVSSSTSFAFGTGKSYCIYLSIEI